MLSEQKLRLTLTVNQPDEQSKKPVVNEHQIDPIPTWLNLKMFQSLLITSQASKTKWSLLPKKKESVCGNTKVDLTGRSSRRA